jgi:hypothetical protein
VLHDGRKKLVRPAFSSSTVEAPTRMGNSTMPPSPKVKASGGEPMKRSPGSGRSTLAA